MKPNKLWLDRFSFHELFEVLEEEDIQVRAVNQIAELSKLEPDIIKIDVQGLELPILKQSDHLLESAFYVETETGFVENYINETTFSQLDEYMRSKGFLMFDININHRISRNNKFQHHRTGKEQILWAETVWLKDYIGLDKEGKLNCIRLNDKKVKKILTLCALQQCYDFGFELAEFFYCKGFLLKNELEALSSIEGWQIITLNEDLPSGTSRKKNFKDFKDLVFDYFKNLKQ